MFNSPLQYCPICKQQVALDQTKYECAREQQCKAENCPLSHLFVAPGSDVIQDEKPGSDSGTRKTIEFHRP
jgi:hypothetical protein